MVEHHEGRRPSWRWRVVQLGKALFWFANSAFGLWIVVLMLRHR